MYINSLIEQVSTTIIQHSRSSRNLRILVNNDLNIQIADVNMPDSSMFFLFRACSAFVYTMVFCSYMMYWAHWIDFPSPQLKPFCRVVESSDQVWEPCLGCIHTLSSLVLNIEYAGSWSIWWSEASILVSTFSQLEKLVWFSIRQVRFLHNKCNVAIDTNEGSLVKDGFWC